MLTYFLFVALTNLVLGAVLGYYYGPMFLAARQSEAPAAEHGHAAQPAAESHDPALAETSASPASESAPEPAAAPVASTAPAAPAEDLRPVKQTGSREVSAVDLADVMSELGVAPPEQAATAPAEAAVAPVAASVPAPTAAAPELALASEAAPLAG